MVGGRRVHRGAGCGGAGAGAAATTTLAAAETAAQLCADA